MPGNGDFMKRSLIRVLLSALLLGYLRMGSKVNQSYNLRVLSFMKLEATRQPLSRRSAGAQLLFNPHSLFRIQRRG